MSGANKNNPRPPLIVDFLNFTDKLKVLNKDNWKAMDEIKATASDGVFYFLPWILSDTFDNVSVTSDISYRNRQNYKILNPLLLRYRVYGGINF